MSGWVTGGWSLTGRKYGGGGEGPTGSWVKFPETLTLPDEKAGKTLKTEA